MKQDLENKLFQALSEEPTLMIGLNRNADHSEPMRACMFPEKHERIWFFTYTDNRCANGGKTSAQFMDHQKGIFASLSGTMVEETDGEIIRELFEPAVSSLYSGGIEDERLHVLRFDIQSIEVWENDMSTWTQFKMLSGINVDQDELGNHAMISK